MFWKKSSEDGSTAYSTLYVSVLQARRVSLKDGTHSYTYKAKAGKRSGLLGSSGIEEAESGPQKSITQHVSEVQNVSWVCQSEKRLCAVWFGMSLSNYE